MLVLRYSEAVCLRGGTVARRCVQSLRPPKTSPSVASRPIQNIGAHRAAPKLITCGRIRSHIVMTSLPTHPCVVIIALHLRDRFVDVMHFKNGGSVSLLLEARVVEVSVYDDMKEFDSSAGRHTRVGHHDTQLQREHLRCFSTDSS